MRTMKDHAYFKNIRSGRIGKCEDMSSSDARNRLKLLDEHCKVVSSRPQGILLFVRMSLHKSYYSHLVRTPEAESCRSREAIRKEWLVHAEIVVRGLFVKHSKPTLSPHSQ
jgi:hypothetical protein